MKLNEIQKLNKELKRLLENKEQDISYVKKHLGEETFNILNSLKDSGFKYFIKMKDNINYGEDSTNDILDTLDMDDDGIHISTFLELNDFYDDNEIEIGIFKGDGHSETITMGFNGPEYHNSDTEVDGVITLELDDKNSDGITVRNFILDSYPNSTLAKMIKEEF